MSIPVPDVSHPQSSAQWLCNSTSRDLEISQLSEQHEETDLEKVLLNQHCGELREELAVKDRESKVLKEEIIKTAEELEEARSRYMYSLLDYQMHITVCLQLYLMQYVIIHF